VPAKQPSPPRGTSAGNCAAAAAATDGRSTLLSPSPVPEPAAADERDGGVRGDGRGDADGFFFLPLEGGITARGGCAEGRGGTARRRRRAASLKPWRPGQEEGLGRREGTASPVRPLGRNERALYMGFESSKI
jgi:hypothetical protein